MLSQIRMSVLQRNLFLLFGTIVFLGMACSGGGGNGETGENLSGDPSLTTSSSKETPKTPPKESVRKKLVTTRPLLEEAARAEVSPEGLLIDFGTADQHKYTLGGWHNGWGKNELDEKTNTTFAKASSRSVPLRTFLQGDDVKEVVLRVRAPRDGQKVSILVDGKDVGNGEIGKEWSIVRIPVEAGAIKAGRHIFNLLFGSIQENKVRAELDWVWFSTASDAKEPLLVPRVMPVRIGELTRRSLVAPTSRAYTFYLHIPKESSLVFDYGAEVDAEFMVNIIDDSGNAQEIFREKAEKGQWKEAQVDISQFAGKPVLFQLKTQGEDGVVGWGEPEFMAPKTPENTREQPTGVQAKNVVLILIDTVRADVFEPFNPGNTVQTPVYDALAKESTTFLYAYDNENWTKPSVATVLSGLYPSTHGAKDDGDVLSDKVDLLPERLKKEGFSTASFIANGYCSEKYGFQQGWDFYRNYIRENRNSSAENVYGDAVEWLKENKDDRFFMYIQTIDPHVPYQVPDEYTNIYHPNPYNGPIGSRLDGYKQADISQGKAKIGKEDYEWIKALYYGEVTYHDKEMGKFLDELKTMGLMEDTLIIITNDHGEELNEHGRLGHGHSLYTELVRAPLLMRYPPLFPEGKLVEDATEGVDITPTILEALGIAPSGDIDGRSVLPLLWNRPESRPGYAISEFLNTKRALSIGTLRLITSGSSSQLFDISQDPTEQTNQKENLLVSLRLTEVYLGEGLANPDKGQRQLDKTTQRRFESGQVEMDPELKKQLEALGYFGDSD